MARGHLIRFLRATRAALNVRAAANELVQGEPYFVTDENRLAVGTSANATVSMATKTEVDAKRDKGIGEFFYFFGTTPPAYALVLDGAAISRTTYAALWQHAQTSGLLASSEGGKTVGEFGPGNGTTTFTLPNLTAGKQFIRSSGSGSPPGTVQSQGTAVNGLSATTTATANALTNQPNTGGALDMARGPASASVSLTSSDAETRPVNISLLPCIVAL